MAKRKFEAVDEEEAWLISYADMITLIACFFILMMAFANYDPKGFQSKVEVVAKHFKQNKEDSSNIKLDTKNEEIAKHPDQDPKSKITMRDGDLNIVYQGSILFNDQSANITDEVKSNLDAMIATIRTLDPNYRVLIEGHTDNIPPKADSQFINNWALSGSRAAAVIERFETAGFDPSKLVTVSYADTRPMAPMEDEKGNIISENQKLNRRVVIKVIKPNKPTENLKLGFGHYFKESVEDVEDLP